jgi:hypothetical protein
MDNIEAIVCECGETAHISSVRYVFDEPELPPLTYDLESGQLAVDDKIIENEQQLFELLGRPFSIADFSGRQLAGEPPGTYTPSPGVVVLAVSGHEVDLISDDEPSISAGIQQIMLESDHLLKGQDLSQGLIGPLAWSRCSGWRSWVGEPGERIEQGELVCINIFAVSALVGYLDALAEPQGMVVERNIGGVPDAISAHGLSVELDLTATALLTMEQALTLAEAASWTLASAEKAIACCRVVVEELKSEGVYITPAAEGMSEVTFEATPELSGLINLASIARKSHYSSEEMLQQVRQLLGQLTRDSDIKHEMGATRNCGCTPLLTYAVRSDSWLAARNAEYLSQGGTSMVSRGAWKEASKVLVEDCPHALSYVTESQAECAEKPLDSLIQEADHNLALSSFTAYGRALKDLDNKTHAVIWAGHNINTVLLEEDLIRGLDKQSPRVDKSIREIQAVSITPDFVLITGPNADQQLVDIQVSAVMRELGTDSPWERGGSIPYSYFLERKGTRSGMFTILPL